MASEELYCMECVEGRPVALGLCADCLAGEPLEEVIRQIARLSRELEALRRIAFDLHWMARRYVDGRSSYATGLFNAHTRALITMGVELNPTADGTIWARDAMGRAYDGLSEEEAALGLPAPDGLYDEDVARLRRELEAARERERRLRDAILAELHGADGVAVAEIGPDGVQRLWEALVQTGVRDA